VTAQSPLAALTSRFAGIGGLAFRAGPGGLLFADVANGQARASVCLQGAQLTHWQPHEQAHPVLWLSDAARYAPGKAIRGGIPVCWPWFGAPPPGLAAAPAPAHGFARTLGWDLHAARTLTDGATELVWHLGASAPTRALWAAQFLLELRMAIGATLELALTSHNTGTHALELTEALHTYFRVGDIGAIAVGGLAGAAYFDAAPGAAAAPDRQRRQAGAVRFDAEVDRVYESSGECWIDDPVLQRRLHIAKSGSAATVVWNPWDAKAERLGDVGPGQWRQMVCVESGNARPTVVHLAPDASHCLTVLYRVAA
jgi:D-hexose-6-phosphate mutarotase